MNAEAARPPSCQRVRSQPEIGRQDGFTLLELIVVVVIIALITSLVVPAVTSMNRASGITKAIYDIAGTLEQARGYAMANNTYVFVGLEESDVTQPASGTQKGGLGRVCVATVATKDGTPGFTSSGLQSWSASYPAFSKNLVPIGKVLVIDNLHLPDLGIPPSTGGMARPAMAVGSGISYSAGNPLFVSATPFDYPVGSSLGGGQYSFTKVIEYDPRGAVRLQGTGGPAAITRWIEIGAQQSNGASAAALATPAATGNIAAIQIDGITGVVRIYRP